MKIVVIATSLTVGMTLDGKPTITLNFPYPVALALKNLLLMPYARPEHFSAGIGILGYTDKLEVAVYAVIPTTEALPVPYDAIVTTEDGNPETFTYIIGNEADIGAKAVTTFAELQRAHGSFYIRCGCENGNQRRVMIFDEWKVQLTELTTSQEVFRRTEAAFSI